MVSLFMAPGDVTHDTFSASSLSAQSSAGSPPVLSPPVLSPPVLSPPPAMPNDPHEPFATGAPNNALAQARSDVPWRSQTRHRRALFLGPVPNPPWVDPDGQ
jgi:hypothetical protein